jgi:quercetin dioxygenase-like cupin family protein
MSGEVKECGGCRSGNLLPLFDMGSQPLAEGGSAYSYPLALVQCQNCGLVQLSYIVDQAEVFRPAHPYATGNSAVLREHYGRLARDLQGNLLIGDLVVDIGANDGTLLRSFSGRRGNPGLKLMAVEPTDQIRKPATYGNQAPLEVYQEFFTAELASRISSAHGAAKVITALNVLAHVPDVHDFLDGVALLLDDDGVFVTENHDLASITEGLQIDTIYHEHLRYYTPGTLCHLLEQHGLRVTSVEPTPMHGGSFRVRARKAVPSFQGRARSAATALRAMLWQFIDKHQAVYGIGATTRATPLIHYAGIKDLIDYVCERAGSDKIGTYIPGTSIAVVDEARLIADQPPYALLLSWHIAGDIIPKLRAAGYQGQFIVPLPEPKVLDDLPLLLALPVQFPERPPVPVSPLPGQGFLMTDPVRMAYCRKDMSLQHPVGECPYDYEEPATVTDRFEDDRGVIQDLLNDSVDAITYIFTRRGAVRGNHVHSETTQWTYVIDGRMLIASRRPDGTAETSEHGPGELIRDEPGVAHAWKALADTEVLVFTQGPRSGANYEDDVQRLAPEDRLIP